MCVTPVVIFAIAKQQNLGNSVFVMDFTVSFYYYELVAQRVHGLCTSPVVAVFSITTVT